MIEIWSLKLIAKIVYMYKRVYFISDILTQEINNWSSTNNQITRGVRGIYYFGVEMLFEIWKPRLTPRFLYFKQHFSNLEVIIQQTRKRKHYFLNQTYL
jgi:hypothetical protein